MEEPLTGISRANGGPLGGAKRLRCCGRGTAGLGGPENFQMESGAPSPTDGVTGPGGLRLPGTERLSARPAEAAPPG